MITKEMTITNKTGLHARPAAALVEIAKSYKADISIIKEQKKINAKSIISVLSAGIKQGTKISLVIDGEDEVRAEQALIELVENNFGEES